MRFWLGPLQVLLSGCCFGLLGIFGKLAFSMGLSVGELLTWRFLIASLVLGLALLFKKASWLDIGLKQTVISLLLGICGYAVFSTLYFESIRGVTVGLAALLLFTFPLFVNIGSFLFLRERMGILQVLNLLLSSAGLVCLVWGDWSVQKNEAVVCGLAAAVAYAAYVLISGHVQKNVRPLSSSFYVIVGAALALALFHRPNFHHLLTLPLQTGLVVLGIAVISTIAPLTLFLAGLQKMPSSQASILVMIEPVVAAACGSFFFHEVMTPRQLTGAALILSALLLQSWKTRPVTGLS